MIAAPRVLLVTRRFWPMANDNMWRISSLGSALQAAAWNVQVLTAQWHSAWPAEVSLREFSVHRLAPSPTTPFRSRRFTRATCDWVARHGSQLDCLIVDATEEDALPLTARSSSDGPPVIVRYDSVPGSGPLLERLRERVITACRQAALVVVPHEHARRELVAADVPLKKIRLIPDGPVPHYDRGAMSRGQARRALADINYELFLRADDRLLICPSELTRQAGVETMVRALGPLLETKRNVRCWILGDGPERSRLVDLLRREGWKTEFLLPGTFEDMEVVFLAADLCLLPGAAQGLSWLLPTALVNGLTTFACDCPAARSRLGAVDGSPLLVEPDRPLQLRNNVEAWLQRPEPWQQATIEAAAQLAPQVRIVDQWRSLVSELEFMRDRSPGRR